MGDSGHPWDRNMCQQECRREYLDASSDCVRRKVGSVCQLPPSVSASHPTPARADPLTQIAVYGNTSLDLWILVISGA